MEETFWKKYFNEKRERRKRITFTSEGKTKSIFKIKEESDQLGNNFKV